MERFYKNKMKHKNKKKNCPFKQDAIQNTQISSNKEMLQYPILEKNLNCLFNPTMYNTAVMCPLLLTASIKINK